jgi:hypothetical protein
VFYCVLDMLVVTTTAYLVRRRATRQRAAPDLQTV